MREPDEKGCRVRPAGYDTTMLKMRGDMMAEKSIMSRFPTDSLCNYHPLDDKRRDMII
jgi:hypothetical protein